AIRTRRGTAAEDAVEATGEDAPFTIRSDTLLWPLIVALCVLVLAGAITNVVEVFLVRGTLGAGPTAFGLVSGLFALAFVAGSVYGGRAASDQTRAQRTIVAAFLLAVGLVGAGLAPTLAVFTIPWAFAGISNGLVNADVNT